MSWSLSFAGRAGKIAQIAAEKFAQQPGCDPNSAEGKAKTAVGEIVASLCADLEPNKAVRIEANGSAWTQVGKPALSQSLYVKLESIGDFAD